MVKLTAAEEKVNALITDAITLISKNGLVYQNNLKIHATIGITCDDQRTFCVGIDKKFRKGTEHDNPGLLPVTSTATPSVASLVGSFHPMFELPQHLKSPMLPPQGCHLPTMMSGQSVPVNASKGQKRSLSPSRDISEPSSVPGANLNHQERASHIPYSQPKQAKVSPISVMPESIEDEDDDQPQNLVIKEEAMSDTENQEQSAPLNMSVNHEESRSTPSREPKVPVLPAPVSSPGFLEKNEDSPAPATPVSSEQDQWPSTSPCLLLKSALNTPQQPRQSPSPKLKTSAEKTVDGKEGDVNFVLVPSRDAQAYQLEKKYVCDQAGCSYMSTRKYNLTRHARTHYEDQRIPCPECSGTFVDKYILKEHMASTHPKFTIPINGTNMIGVGIGSTTKATSEPLIGPLLPGQERPVIPPGFFTNPTAPNKRKKGVPNRNRNTPSPKTSRKTGSPGLRLKSSPASSWHIPAANGPSIGSSMDASTPSVEEMIKMMGVNSEPAPVKEPIRPSSDYQIVFPGMLELNNNDPKTDDEEATPVSSPASGANMPVFPGMMGGDNGQSNQAVFEAGTAQLATTTQ